MKRLFGNSAIFIWILLASAAPGSVASAAEEAVQKTREAFLTCQVEGLATVDDGVSDPSSIAFALTSHCEEEYAAMTKAIARHNLDNSNEQRMFTIDQNAKVIKIEVSLPLVLEHRQERSKLPD